jgi:hypothetical protein
MENQELSVTLLTDLKKGRGEKLKVKGKKGNLSSAHN